MKNKYGTLITSFTCKTSRYGVTITYRLYKSLFKYIITVERDDTKKLGGENISWKFFRVSKAVSYYNNQCELIQNE